MKNKRLTKSEARELLLDHHMQYALSQHAYAPRRVQRRRIWLWARWLAIPTIALTAFLLVLVWRGSAPTPTATSHTLARAATTTLHGITVTAQRATHIDHRDPQTWVQHNGRATYNVPPQDDQSFSVQTRHGTVSVLGTAFELAVDDRSRLRVFEGRVQLNAGPSSRILQTPDHYEFNRAARAPQGAPFLGWRNGVIGPPGSQIVQASVANNILSSAGNTTLHQVPDSSALLAPLRTARGLSLETVFYTAAEHEHVILELNMPVGSGWDLIQLRIKPEYLRANTWQHAVVGWDAVRNRITTYVDGMMVTQQTRSLTPEQWQHPVLLKMNPPITPERNSPAQFRYAGVHLKLFSAQQVAERSLGFLGLRQLKP